MKLNCKPGDLAFTVGMVNSANNGKIVKVVRLYLEDEILPRHRFAYQIKSPTWVCESLCGPLSVQFDGMQQMRAIDDKCLRPIRDNDGEDETLQWVPRKVTA